jgi:hypothetical protein
MITQHQIKRTLSKQDNIDQIRLLLDLSSDINRTMLAKKLCEQFGFFDNRGKKQVSSCLKALRDLEDEGRINLPPPKAVGRIKGSKPKPRRLLKPLPDPQDVPSTAGAVQGLRLVAVDSEQQMRTWNEMMIQEHTRGAGPLVGRQMRYLIDSDHGLLGGVGFGAAALKLRDRDQWIGWDAETRRELLHRVIGLSRFLIRATVHCHNLASRVLGLCMQQFPVDFETRYGFRLWIVETFVDTSQFSGTSFRAANWEMVGKTQGRGRQDRYSKRAETSKEIYVYTLNKDFRASIIAPATIKEDALTIDEDLESDRWAQAEFGGAALGDRRLTKRLVSSASACAEKPGRAFCGVAEGDWPSVKGYYRLIDSPNDSAVTMENILKPHRERTIRRMKSCKDVLCIQDGSDLDFSGRPHCSGLGIIGKNQTGAKSKGLHLHSTLAVTTDGIPLGVLQSECAAPKEKSKQDNRRIVNIPIEEKKTFCWIEGLRDCMELTKEMLDTRLISVMDREADFFELFDEQRQNPCVELLVRAQYNRCTTGELKLFDAVKQTPELGKILINVSRQSARPKKSKVKARPKRLERTAEVSLRYKRIKLKPPPYHKQKEPIAVWIVHALEDNPPGGVEPLEWFLITTVEIHSVEQAESCLGWYCLRWRIEDWHRVLKSGCRIEHMAHKTAERLRRAISINMVIAWRIMLMTLLGREIPELPTEVLFSDLEIKVLSAYAKKNT